MDLKPWMIGMLLVVSATPGLAQRGEVTGTWRLDRTRSDAHPFTEAGRMAPRVVTTPAELVTTLPEAETLVLARVGDQFSVERSHRSDGPGRVARLDGVGRTVAGGSTLRAWVEAATTVIEVVRPVTLPEGRVIETRTTERFTVQADGTLLHDRRLDQDGTPRTWRFVYTRVP